MNHLGIIIEMASSPLFSSSGWVGLTEFQARVGSGFESRAAGRVGSGRAFELSFTVTKKMHACVNLYLIKNVILLFPLSILSNFQKKTLNPPKTAVFSFFEKNI